MNADTASDFQDLPSLLGARARQRPDAMALWADGQSLSYRALDERVDRVAATLQHHGFKPCDTIAICAASSINYIALFLGALRAGLAFAPLAPSSTAAQLAAMVDDADSRLVFLDAATAASGVRWPTRAQQIRLDDGAFEAWLVPNGSPNGSPDGPPAVRPTPVAIDPAWPFILI